jgi:hypothetical protein
LKKKTNKIPHSEIAGPMFFARNPAEPDDPNSSILNADKQGSWG